MLREKLIAMAPRGKRKPVKDRLVRDVNEEQACKRLERGTEGSTERAAP